MLLAFVSAIASAGSVIYDKWLLTRERLSISVMLSIGFVLVAGITMFLTPFFGAVDWDLALLPNSLFLLFIMIILAMAWNVLYYQGLQKQKVHDHELMMMLAPVLTILLAAVFYQEDLDMRVFWLAIIASVALLFAKGQKEHFFLNQNSYNTFLAVVLLSAESIVIRELLYSYTPVALYAVRTVILAVFFMLYYRPRSSQMSIRHWWMIAGSALLGVILMLTRYYAFAETGIIYTMLVLVISPMIVYFASWEMLHEKIRPRVLIAAVVILTCVTLATTIIFSG
ncbi:MAG: EamA family transporter [Patescibacteria group bacterium]